jgi:hypothetical protein
MRWRLLWSARSDRRAGLPIGLSAETTPVLRDLVARRDDACEHERTRYKAAIEPVSVRLAEIEADVVALERQLAERTAEVARTSVKPDESRLSERRAGEQELPVELVRQRRLAEHSREEAAARAAADEIEQRLDRVRAEQAHLSARQQSRADVARSRVLRLVQHADRMAAVYRRALVRRHPQREALVVRWSTELAPPPAWVLTDDLVPSHRPAGVHA